MLHSFRELEMNFAHLHLILNHIPVIGIPIALAFLIFGIFSQSSPTQKFSLFMLFLLGPVALPVYLTGEPAEKLIEHLPGFVESFVDSHEDAALVSLILSIVTSIAAFVALWFQKDEKKRRIFNFGVVGIACITIISLLYTANLGGQIRHTEIRAGSSAPLNTSNPETKKEK